MFSKHSPIPPPKEIPDLPASHYGYGWLVKEEDNGTVARHGGALACTASSLMHFPDNTNLAVLFNLGQFPDGKFLSRSIEKPLTELVRKVEHWPGAKEQN